MTLSSVCEPLPADDNNGPMLVIATCALFAPTMITTILRIWVRAKERTLGPDDHFMIVAALLSLVLGSLNIAGVHYGKGRHICYLESANVITIGKLSWINQIVLFVTVCLIKISICLLILRIKNSTRFRWFVGAVIALMLITNVEAIITLLAECTPVYGFWDRKHGTCRSPNLRIYSIWVQASVAVFTDLLCSLLPVMIVWKLQLPTRKKIGICGLMGLGLIATAFAALRASSLGTNIADTTYAYAATGTWMTIEANIGIIAANLAPMRGIIHHFRRRRIQTSPSHGSRSHHLTSLAGIRSRLGEATWDQDVQMEGRHLRNVPFRGSCHSEMPLKTVTATEQKIALDGHRSSSELGGHKLDRAYT